MCLMKPAHPSVMTPQPLSCVMHHILLPSSSEHGCHRASRKAPLEASHKLRDTWQKKGGEGGSLIRRLLNFSNSGGCHPHLLFADATSFFFHPFPSFLLLLLLLTPDRFITEQKKKGVWLNEPGGRCESSLCEPIVTIHY